MAKKQKKKGCGSPIALNKKAVHVLNREKERLFEHSWRKYLEQY